VSNTLSHPLRRSRDDRMVAGVCGGIAKWLGWDPTAVRAIYVIASLVSAGFPGIIAYVVLWFIMPEEGYGDRPSST
jgi:phage shock protein C